MLPGRRHTVFEIDLGNPQTFWLNVANIALGVVTLSCFAVVGLGTVIEAFKRSRARLALADENDDHAFAVPGLGLTMADGGSKRPAEEED
jgi:hypothetical protein